VDNQLDKRTNKMKNKKEKATLKSEFILLCDYAFIGDGGKLCVIGKFETIFVRDLPSAHPEMFIVAHFSGEPNSTHDLRLSIIDPSGKEMIPSDAPNFKIQLSGYGTGNFIHRLFNFPINNAGDYSVSFSSGKNKIGSSKISIIRIKENTNTPN
jgi:hypothetical protein